MSAKPVGIILIAVIFIIGFLYFKMDQLEKARTNAQESAYLSQQGVLSATDKIPAVTANDHIKGNPNAKVTIVEYSDFECPACQQFQPTIKQIMQTYGKDIRWVVRNYPLPQHPNAEKEAEAAECAASIGGNGIYWKYSDTIFTRSYSGGTGYALTNLVPLAKELGINQSKFSACLNSGQFASLIKTQTDNAITAGVYELPTTFVIDAKGNTKIIASNQSFAVYKTILDLDLQNS